MINLSDKDLKNKMDFYFKNLLESKQVANRIKKLLPYRFKRIKNKITNNKHSLSKLSRLALTNENYINYLQEYINILSFMRKMRIKYEISNMIYESRVSIRSVNIVLKRFKD